MAATSGSYQQFFHCEAATDKLRLFIATMHFAAPCHTSSKTRETIAIAAVLHIETDWVWQISHMQQPCFW